MVALKAIYQDTNPYSGYVAVALVSMTNGMLDQNQRPLRAWGTKQAMDLCGYKDRKSFHSMCVDRGAPVAKVNKRVFRYDPIEFQAWWKRMAA